MNYMRLTPPHEQIEIKPAHLDQDRCVELTIAVANHFCTAVNNQLQSEKKPVCLQDISNMRLFIDIITNSRVFPFSASLNNQGICLSPNLEKMENPKLKDISDGVTDIVKEYAGKTNLNESGKFTLSLLFQRAINSAYQAAGMGDGAHTKYVVRGC
jgi:hypothetical protein